MWFLQVMVVFSVQLLWSLYGGFEKGQHLNHKQNEK